MLWPCGAGANVGCCMAILETISNTYVDEDEASTMNGLSKSFFKAVLKRYSCWEESGWARGLVSTTIRVAVAQKEMEGLKA